MKISIRGWKRDHGDSVLAQTALSDWPVSDEVSVYKPGHFYIEPKMNGFSISTDTEKLALNGNYQISLFLTWKDIIFLFFTGTKFERFAQRMSKLRIEDDEGQ